MGRKERNNVDYFPFICEEGKKMFYIEETYGNDGFATFVKILRELAKVEYHYLDLSKQTTVMFLSAKCKVSKETLLSIINDLVDLGKFDRVLWIENKVIWCQDFIDSINDAYEKRKNKCITYQGLFSLLISLGVRKRSKSNLNGGINTHTIVEDSIEEKRIVEDGGVTSWQNCQKYTHDQLTPELQEMYSQEYWDKWKAFNGYIDKQCPNIRLIDQQIKIFEYGYLKKDFIDTKRYTHTSFLKLLDKFDNYKPGKEKYNSAYKALKGWLENEYR